MGILDAWLGGPERRTRDQARWQATLATMGEENVVAEFQRRRKRLIPWTLFPAGLGMVILTVANASPKRDTEEIVGIMTGFVLLGVGIAFTGFTYRCPVCNQPPWTSMGGGRGVSLDPPDCPTCHARLR